MKNSCGYEWDKDGQCGYCGSISAADAIKYLKQPGTKFSGADWKYGWPHKFYLAPVNPEADKEVVVGSWYENGGETKVMGKKLNLDFKFYNKHLADATDEEFKEFSALSTLAFGISWEKTDKGVTFKAPHTESFYGWQLWGVVDENGKPDHSEMEHEHFGA